MSSSNRHPFVVLGATASLITVLGFFGVRGWAPDPPAPAAQTDYRGPSTASHSPSVAAPALSSSAAPASSESSRPTPTAAAAVTCVIEDRLGNSQVSESVWFRIGSKTWRLTVNESDRQDRLSLRFPKAGIYRYGVTVQTETTGGDNLRGEGTGTIDCQGGQTFLVSADASTDPVDVILYEL